MKYEESTVKPFLLGALIGGAIGTITALLLAPKSGRELRSDIADKARDIYDKASGFVGTIKNNIFSNSDEEDENSSLLTSTDDIQQRFEHIKEAVKSGADAFKSELLK